VALLEAPRAEAIATMVLACIHREYPVHIAHLLRSDADARPPRELTPAFYGSFDWHSAVHSHWCLIRLARLSPAAAWRGRALAAVGESLTPGRLAGERAYLEAEGRQGFERPYGLAWLLQLSAELREWSEHDAQAGGWLEALSPLESIAANRIAALLGRLPWPVRGGEHSQTAFSLGLVADWAVTAGRRELSNLIRDRARIYYGEDRAAPIAYEPCGHDFLSPALAEADLMRRVLERDEFVAWLERFLPDPASEPARRWLSPVTSPDASDGKLSHLDGLNLSRAWMMEGVADALDRSHAWRPALERAAERHAEACLTAVPTPHYAGMHWLGSFAVYLLTRRGIRADVRV
jgi:hypothetical protein